MSATPRMQGEAGATLVELLVTIAILGIAFTALLGGTFTMVTASDRHRKAATAETVLATFAEALKTVAFDMTCTPGTYKTESGYSPPPGFTADVTSCCWLPLTPSTTTTAASDAPPATPVTGDPCPAAQPGALPVQRLTLQVTSDESPPKASESIQIVVRG